jgi:hypothetical protein
MYVSSLHYLTVRYNSVWIRAVVCLEDLARPYSLFYPAVFSMPIPCPILAQGI